MVLSGNCYWPHKMQTCTAMNECFLCKAKPSSLCFETFHGWYTLGGHPRVPKERNILMTTYRVTTCKDTVPLSPPPPGHSRVNLKLWNLALLHVVTTDWGGRGERYWSPSRFLRNEPGKHQRPLASTNVLEDGYKPWVGVTHSSPLSFPWLQLGII